MFFYVPFLNVVFNFFLVFFLLFLKYFVDFDILSIDDLLVTSREALCFLVILLLLQAPSFYLDDFQASKLKYFFVLFVALSFFVVLFQFLLIPYGVYIGFPVDYFVFNINTYASIEKALFYNTTVRPAGFYGEPSYMGFVLITLVVSYFYLYKNYSFVFLKRDFLFFIFIFILFYLIKSSAALFSLIILFFFMFGGRFYRYWFVWVACFFLFFLFGDYFFDRIVNASDDYSFFIRFSLPVEMINELVFYEGNYFGVANTISDNYFYAVGVSGLDNAFYNLVIRYGFLSIFIVFYLLFAFYKHAGYLGVVYMILVFNFNGSVFSYDKVVVLSIFILISSMKPMLYSPLKRGVK